MDVNLTNKEAHEAFVSGHAGTTVTEIAIVVSVAPVSVLLHYAVSCALRGVALVTWVKFCVDFILLMLPTLLCSTVLADNSLAFLVTFTILTITLLISAGHRNASEPHDIGKIFQIEMAGKRPFLTSYRSFVNAASAICILAVDYAIFPRRFCKTEKYGTGLMDVGVAAFVFSNAIVSPEARRIDWSSEKLAGRWESIVRAIKSTAPLWILGLGRLVSVKSTGYHEHVTEYGVHWNFFFTLAIIRVLSAALFCLVDARRSWLLAVAVAGSYQSVLSLAGLGEFLLDHNGSRDGLFNANREGICSCLGYLALYFAGVQLGSFLMRQRSCVRDWLAVLGVLVSADIVFWLLLVTSEAYIDRVSRRLANVSYVIWMMAYNFQCIASFLAVDIIAVVHAHRHSYQSKTVPVDGDTSDKGSNAGNVSKTPKPAAPMPPFDLLEAVNRNGLFYFLLSNLLTGAVNFSTTTMNASSSVAFVQLTLYMLVLSTIAAALHCRDLTVKFW